MTEELFTIDQEDLARCLWTIGDINRLKILQLLPHSANCEQGNNVGQIAEQLELSQPTVSNHLARLRTLGIVKHRRMCRDVYYWIDQEKAAEIVEGLEAALKMVSKKDL